MNSYFEGCISGIIFMMIIYLINLGIKYYLLTRDKPPNWINWEDDF